eukprot:gene15297-16874_t
MQKVVAALVLGLISFVCFTSSQKEFDAGVGEQQATFGQKLDEEALKKQKADAINMTQKRTFIYHSPDNKPMAVYDKLFPGSVVLQLRSYLTSLGQDSWLFNNYDPDHLNKQRASDNVPWVNYRDPTEFNRMLVSKTLAKAITDVTGKDEEWYPYKVTGKVLRRGDHTKVVADTNATDEFSALIYLVMKWRKNHYGELYFFDDEKEIMHGVTPRTGRVVIWDSSILRLTRPPSVSQKQGQILLHIQYTKSKQKMMDEHDNWLSFWSNKMEAKKSWYLYDYKETPEKPLVPNVADHVVGNYSTQKGEKIYVFDDLFPVELLDHMRSHVLKYGTYYYDDSIDQDSDNVQWIAGLDMPDYLKSPYWKVIQAVATFVTGSPEWFPYDVGTNLIRNADHTRIHLDTATVGEREWTFLVYLTQNWTQNYYGETAYYERNSDDTEIVAEVRPRYGRAVIFQGQIPHSARPPSLKFTGARLTFVTKLQPNEFEGRYKNFVEEVRHFRSRAGSVESLDALAATGDTASYLEQMRAIRQQTRKYSSQEQVPAVNKQEEGSEEGAQEGAEGAEEGAEGEEEGAEGAEEGAEGAEEGGEGAEEGGEGPEEGGEGPEEGGEEEGEEEDPNPDVKYITDAFKKIGKSKNKDPAKLVKLYKELKQRESKIMAEMAEKFPSML